MADSDVELQEKLVEAGNSLLKPPSDVGGLLSLLDLAESLLSKVEQSPPELITAALHPLIDALVAKDLLDHLDVDVKASLASCISEIARITAPEAPYDDDVMKKIFKLIVETFKGLDDISGRSYDKRVSILETVAKVRLCVVMLDLECDGLVLEMFQHFLNTVRNGHVENVFSLMESIMTIVIEESEEISSELLSCLLTHVKKDDTNVSSIASSLAEGVIGQCAAKLKSPLLAAIQSSGASLFDYSIVVVSICQEKSNRLESSDFNASGQRLEEHKLPEKTVSDELIQSANQVSAQMKAGADCSEEVGIAAGKLTEPSVRNGAGPPENDKSINGPLSQNGKHKSPPKTTAGPNKSESVTLKVGFSSGQSTNRARSRKFKSSDDTMDATDLPEADSEKRSDEVPGKRTINRKKAKNLQVKGLSSKKPIKAKLLEDKNEVHPPTESDSEATPTESEGKKTENVQGEGPSDKEPIKTKLSEDQKKIDVSPATESDSETTRTASPIATGSILGVNASRRGRVGRPSRKVSSTKGNSNAKNKLIPAFSKRKRAQKSGKAEEEEAPSKNAELEKQTECSSDSEAKPLSQLTIKRHKTDVHGKEMPRKDASAKEEHMDTSDLEARGSEQAERKRPKGKESSVVVPEEKQQRTINRGRSHKQMTIEKDVDERSLKEMISSPKAQSKSTDNLSEKSLKTKSRAKKTQDAETSNLSKDNNIDENLVGSSIKVWWPDDERFYRGVVDSFDAETKKHKVLYADGDIEVLMLKDERWELADGECVSDEDGVGDVSDLSQIQRKGRRRALSAKRQSQAGTPSRRSTGNRNNVGSTLKTGSKSKEKSVASTDKRSPRTADAMKNRKEPSGTLTDSRPETGDEIRNSTPKTLNKSKDGTPKSGSMGKDAIKSSSKSKSDDEVRNTKDSAEGSLKAGRNMKGLKSPREISTNGLAGKVMISSKVEDSDDSPAKAMSTSGKMKKGSRKRGRPARN